MDYIKEAFQRVKEDIFSLTNELNLLKEELQGTKQNLSSITTILNEISEKITQIHTQKNKDVSSSILQKQDNNPYIEQGGTPTHKPQNQTTPTHPSTHNIALESLKPQNIAISTGNQGVSTDRQTDRQTDQQTEEQHQNSKNSIDNAAEILDSLDSIKKEIRLKFKGITGQELLVFSTIYQLDEEGKEIDYRVISKRLGLTESSIRDYVQRLIKKGIPVEKKKVNNKNVRLFISPNLKKIASLSTILQLREL